MDFSSFNSFIIQFQDIQNKINKFKISEDFNFSDYSEIVNYLENLINSFTSLSYDILGEDKLRQYKIIQNTKNNFLKYLIVNLYKTAINQTKEKNYISSLETITKLENLLSSKINVDLDTNKINANIQIMKKHCEFHLDCNKIDHLLAKKDYKQAITLYQNLLYKSDNENEYKICSKKLLNAKIEYLKDLTINNSKLLQLNDKKIILDCEDAITRYKNDLALKNSLHEVRVLYGMALENVIKEKISNKENCDEELNKYKSLTDIENVQNKLKQFNNQNEINKMIGKSSGQDPKEKEKFVYKEISIDTIKEYLQKIQSLNEEGISEELKEDIILQVKNYNQESKKYYNSPKDWLLKNKENIKNYNFRGNIFAFFNSFNKHILKYEIRPIQLISLLFLSKKKHTKNDSKLKGIFLQINTGEGKSLIIQFFAAYLALLGNKVDIISSNTVLADRDAEDGDKIKFYTMLGLTVGRASKNNEYDRDIVYGDTQNFEAGILKEEFKEEKIRHNRPFHCVIVDEVDSISLDNIITMTQLTDNFPGRSCFYYFYYQILIIYCDYVSQLRKNLEQSQQNFFKLTNEFKDNIKTHVMEKFKEKHLNDDQKTLKDDLPIVYPKCMKKYIENSLNDWIENLIRATMMREDKDFIKRDNNIVPVDYLNTGVLQDSMVWEGGLQQFLQIIHDEKGTYENESTNFLSNISFFKRYNGNIFGVTGTFGGSCFQFILKEVYEIDLFIIPPNKTSLLIDEKGFICREKEEYTNKILDKICEIISKKRSVLLICNSIAEGKEFYDILSKIYKENTMYYFTEKDKPTIDNILDVDKIIVATNLAGRGTDIKISDKLEENGGLHVLVSFLPLNQRIEDQNYGRAGRKGQKGSHSLIMLYKGEFGPLGEEELNISYIREKREEIEFKGIKQLIKNEMIFIQQKEELFQKFCQHSRLNYKNSDNFQKACIEEKWGIILKGKDIETIEKDFLKLTQEDDKKIDNNLIKIQQIVHDADNSDNFDKKIFDLEPEYSWAARIRYACLLAKENVKNGNDKLYKKKQAIKEFEKVKETLEIFLEDLSSQSFLNKTVFSFFAKNKEIIKQKDFKTKIEMQNENCKNFLEVLKLLINKNIDKIEKFIDEYEEHPNNILESDEFLTIEQIIKKSEKINDNYESDIKMYLNEFGFETFEMLKISSYPNFLTNIIVFAVGIMEICAGCMILYFAKDIRMIKMAQFLINEGVSDIIESIKATFKDEEINLKEWGKKKAVKIISFSFELLICKGAGEITNSMKEKIVDVLKDQIKTSIKSYVNSWASEKIINNIVTKFTQIFKDNSIQPEINTEDDKYIQFDIINQTDEYKNAILKQYKTIFNKSESLINFIGPIVDIIKKLISDKYENTERFKLFLDFLTTFDFKGFKNELVDIYKSINKLEVNVQLNKNLSHLILQSNKDYNKDEIDNICKELIECGAINKDGHFKSEFIKDKNFNQSFSLEIDKKYNKFKYNNKNEISDELNKILNNIAFKVSEKALNNKKREIKEEISKEIENYFQRVFKDILDCLVNKAFDKFEDLYKKYKKRKENKNIIAIKGKINQLNDIRENNELPEMNSEEIQKSKSLDFGLIAKNCAKTGIKLGFEKIKEKLITNLTAKILNSIKEIINELLKRLLLQFDVFFEEIGTQLMILNEEIKVLDKIICKIRKILDLFSQIKSFVSKILQTVIKISKKGDINIEEVSSKLDNILKKGIKNFIKPIDDFIYFITNGFREVVKEEYKNIKEKGIDYYKNIKKVVGDKYNEIKDSYIISKNTILDLPDNIERLFKQKKMELQRKYEEQKENIKNSTDLKIKDIENIDLHFMKIFSNIKSKIINIIIEKIKNSKNNILNISSEISYFFEDIIKLINQILKIDFGEFSNIKIIISKQIATFVLVIISGKYTIKINNNKIKENDVKDKLILYLQSNLEIENNNKQNDKIKNNKVKKIVKLLIKEGIINILMEPINQIIDFTEENFNIMKDYYDSTIIMINEYFILSQQNIKEFICDNFEKFNEQ